MRPRNRSWEASFLTILLPCLLTWSTEAWLSPLLLQKTPNVKQPQNSPRASSLHTSDGRPSSVLFSSSDHENDLDKTFYINPLLSTIKPSATVALFSRVQQLRAEGQSITSLCVGEPDFPPFPAVRQAAIDAVHAGDTRYTAVTGTLALRQAIAADLQRRKGVTYDAKSEIVVGNGAKQSVYQGILASAGKGDVVLVPAPYWPSYPDMVGLAGAEPVIVETTAKEGYLLTPEKLEDVLNQYGNRVKLLILCNPSNPTGGVYSQQQLEALAEVLGRFPQVRVLADEIYERLVYTPGISHAPSMSSVPGFLNRTITINGFSKAYAMTGLRLGYAAAPAHIAKAISTVQSQLTSCAGSLSQAAGVAALEQVSDNEITNAVQVMREKRDFVLHELKSTMDKYLSVEVPPQGAFYLLPAISAEAYRVTGTANDMEFCQELLERHQLAVVPGSNFGAPDTVRISYATSKEELGEAMDKLRAFLNVS